MGNKRIINYFLYLICLVIFSNTLIYSQSPPTIFDYFPLKVGNEWRYSLKYLSGDVTMIQTIKKYEAGVYVIENRVIIDGYDVGKGSSYDIKLSDSSVTQIANDNETIIHLKSPLKIGTTWKWSENKVATIVGIGVRCEVPAGIFRDCVKLKVKSIKQKQKKDDKIDEDVYFARGVGPIKRFGTTVLTGYNINN